MYAVVTTGGKQYRVEAGNELTIERLAADAGASVTFDRVLLVGDGDTVTVGTPTVDGATVSATVLGEALGPKLVVFKFKQKVKYRRTTGHRQHLTRVRIDEISASGKSSKAERAPKASAAKAEGSEATEAAATAKPTRTRRATGSATDKPAAAKPAPRSRTTKAAATKAAATKAAARDTDPAAEAGAEAPNAKRTRKAAAPKATPEADAETQE
jgi:large subunit ribosomal protein L21